MARGQLMRSLIGRFGAVVVLAAGCSSGKAPASPAADLTVKLQALLDSSYAAAPQVPGIILRVEAPAIGLVFSGAVGKADMKTGEALTPEHTVRMASNTKTYISAAVLRLVEDGKVGLDSSIGRYLLPASVKRLKAGGYDPAKITVRMVLHHTSGLFDYGMSDPYQRAVGADFSHRWTRVEQLGLAVDSGKPYGAPDEVYHYSDTGYILLGELLEQVTGTSMPKAVSDLVGFDAHGIKYTYFETLDSVPPGTPPRAHQYLDSTDTYRLDASHDLYGGGGLVSNAENMARFYRALVRGDIFHNKATLDEMLTVTAQSEKEHGAYGMGIGRGEVDGVSCYGHGGFWGTYARHCPAVDLTVVVADNGTSDEARKTLRSVLDATLKLAIAAIPAKR